MMTIDDRGLFESSWGASREITLKDALREMDVHEAAPDTPIIVFPDPGQESATAATQEAYLNLIGTADRIIAAEHTAHTVCAEDIEALMRALLDMKGIPPDTALRARLQRVGDILRIAGNRTSLSDQAYIECIARIDDIEPS